MSNNITPIFGRLKNVTKENPYVAGAVDIKDDVKNKNQQTINQENDTTFAEHEEHLSTHDIELLNRYTKEETNNIISRTPETDVIVIEVPAASQSDIAEWLDANTPSGTDPETGRSVRANKLYRVPGPDNTTFSEWAWNGIAYIMLANKDYGIDDYPLHDSNNMVKSSGVLNGNMLHDYWPNYHHGFLRQNGTVAWDSDNTNIIFWLRVKEGDVISYYGRTFWNNIALHKDDGTIIQFDYDVSHNGVYQDDDRYTMPSDGMLYGWSESPYIGGFRIISSEDNVESSSLNSLLRIFWEDNKSNIKLNTAFALTTLKSSNLDIEYVEKSSDIISITIPRPGIILNPTGGYKASDESISFENAPKYFGVVAYVPEKQELIVYTLAGINHESSDLFKSMHWSVVLPQYKGCNILPLLAYNISNGICIMYNALKIDYLPDFPNCIVGNERGYIDNGQILGRDDASSTNRIICENLQVNEGDVYEYHGGFYRGNFIPVWGRNNIEGQMSPLSIGFTSSPQYSKFVIPHGINYITAWTNIEDRFSDDFPAYIKKISSSNKKPFSIIHVGKGGDYEDLNEAIYCAGDSAENPVTIIVAPGTYYMRARVDGEWSPRTGNRYLSIIGTDKNNCVLVNNEAVYTTSDALHRRDAAPLRLSGNCYIANLTIISGSEDYDESLGIPKDSYCVHVDFDANSGSVFEIDNCRMINDHNSCIGYGVRSGCTIIVKDCDLTTTMSNTENFTGTIWGHDINTDGEKNIVVKNCIIRNTNAPRAIAALNAYGKNVQVTLIGNTCKTSDNNNAFSISPVNTLTDISRLNNITAMNYQQ